MRFFHFAALSVRMTTFSVKLISMKDFLIIGQGIAGSILAFELLHRHKTVVVIDNAHHGSSSVVAAGILNPVTGKRFTITENYDRLFFQAASFYHELERLFGQPFFELKPIVRIFQNEEERAYWLRRAGQSAGQHYVEQMNPPHTFSPRMDDPFGSILITSSGFCHSARLIDVFRQYFQERHVLKTEKVSYDYLKVEKDHVVYAGEKYGRVIFCEGYQARFNPWFQWIPFQPVKGEILKIAMDETGLPNAIIHKGKWVVPLGDGQWTAGSNYIWDKVDGEPTEEGRNEIVKHLQVALNRPMNAVQHQAGVRMATTDQKPVLGLHPEHSALGILNGFSSKGFLMAPTYAVQLARFLCHEGIIDEAVALTRYLDKIKKI